ncbi:M14 family metallopeptidase [Halalkalibacter urbisdiaboli]|uniref:M14 family metallopeptidase n=1 Tax=Halalkalibacter urbisdiaboli TaxID=1960589 RepID=UPI000B4367ED|nr:M14 family metallopeptidase [Halalkalibacter urbisdiaboli]
MNYSVRQGDTVAKVANAFQIRPFDLVLFNPRLTSEHEYIQPGMILHIPNTQNPQQKLDLFDHRLEFGPNELDEMIPTFKKLGVRVEVIGFSVMKKPIYALSIGRGKKEIFYSGGWHANEWHTSKFLTKFVYELATAYESQNDWYGYNIVEVLEKIKLFVVPLVNPDGVELVQQGIYSNHPYYDEVVRINKGETRFEHWSSNIRGVDLNHQWPAGWEIEAKESPQTPWSRHYSGTEPLTEPEVKAVYRLSKRLAFAHVVAFHSQGQVIYWGYRGLEPECSKQMVERLALVSSYLPVHTADSDGGYKDWFIQETGRPGFTVEVGIGTNPLPNKAFAEIWSNNVLLALEGLVI